MLGWLLEQQFSSDLLRHFNKLRIVIELKASALAAQFGSERDHETIAAGWDFMEAAEAGNGELLAADVAVHVAVLGASRNPLYIQFQGVVASALQTSIRVTNRIKGRTASLANHAAVRGAVAARDVNRARSAMGALIADVITLIELSTST